MEKETTIKKKLELAMGVIVLCAAAILGRQGAKLVSAVSTAKEQTGYHVVIDVGHGGMDGGKISEDGKMEKDINLQIALKLKKIFLAQDVAVTMTRESDCGLYKESDRNKKVTDLKNRVALIAGEQPDCVVSIHQNSYPSPDVRGAQVFYYGQSAEGEALAKLIQESLVKRVDPENHRQAKANESYYLLKKTSAPTVIVECGFLSSPEESALLADDEYQEKLAWAIHLAVMNYLNQQGTLSDSIAE